MRRLDLGHDERPVTQWHHILLHAAIEAPRMAVVHLLVARLGLEALQHIDETSAIFSAMSHVLEDHIIDVLGYVLQNVPPGLVNQVKNKQGELPLEVAVKSGSVMVVEMLLIFGADRSLLSSAALMTADNMARLHVARGRRNRGELVSLMLCFDEFSRLEGSMQLSYEYMEIHGEKIVSILSENTVAGLQDPAGQWCDIVLAKQDSCKIMWTHISSMNVSGSVPR